MACSWSYTDCIKRHRHGGAEEEPHIHQSVGTNERRLPSGLGRAG